MLACRPSSRSAPTLNPHSARCQPVPNFPRLRALALFGRRPDQPAERLVVAGVQKPAQERTKDTAFQTSRLHVQSRTGHSADKGSADSLGQSHQGKARLIGIQLRGKLWMGAWDVFACFGGPLQASPPTGRRHRCLKSARSIPKTRKRVQASRTCAARSQPLIASKRAPLPLRT